MVEIFGFEGYNCKYCHNAKRLCEARKIPYIYIPVNDGVDENGRPVKIDSIIADIQDRAGVEVIATMPQIFYNGDYIGGFDEFRSFVVKNKING